MPVAADVARIDPEGDVDRVRSALDDWRRPVVFGEGGRPAFRRFAGAWTARRYNELVGDEVGHVRYYPEGDRGPASQARPAPYREVFEAISREVDAPNLSTRLAAGDPRHLAFSRPLFDDVGELCADLASLSWGGHVFDTVWFGGTGTITPLHYDPVSRLHGVLSGRKRFTLFPADRRHLAHLEVCPLRSETRNYSRIGLGPLDPELFPGLREATPVDADLGPGDVLYIPPCWWHHVTISEPFTVTASVAYFPRELYRVWPFWRLKLGALLSRLPAGGRGAADGMG